MSHPRPSPSFSVQSTAISFGVGSAPGNARHTGQVWELGLVPKPFSHRQNIFVRVFSWTWISRPMTGSHSGMVEPPLCVEQGDLDVTAYLEDLDVLLERAVHANEAELPLARFEGEPNVADLDSAGTVEHARPPAAEPHHGEDEVGGGVVESLHRKRSVVV